MTPDELYSQRLARYVTAMRNEKPDRVPLRPFVAEFTARYAGYTCQQVAHDYRLAFDAALRCARDFDWDAVVPNMVAAWTGMAQAAGLRYYGIPGIGIPPDVGFNYIEPPEEQAFMRADEYDALIDDPNAFLSLFYAEGKWDWHFDAFRELPDRSIVFHCDRDDLFEVHRRLHDKFALSGGIPNVLLSWGQPNEVREFCARVLREVARDGGYVMDAGAIMQNDTRVENLRVMTQVCRDLGAYPRGSYAPPDAIPPSETPASIDARRSLVGLEGRPQPRIPPGISLPWSEKANELPEITGDPDLVRAIWDEIEGLGNTYIWQLLLAF
ncbi:MAG TPA: uroporphyrinogen decarboxylase family protein [Verrucomicrobiota bacterium]|nr:uroporphyrinogen decarboxylase family protein [Verrucomicrobiota bacterium]HRZ36749.1 uroporphyrinogen decarboxylase family protein [Candidatus Paceibacterota bacterium]